MLAETVGKFETEVDASVSEEEIDKEEVMLTLEGSNVEYVEVGDTVKMQNNNKTRSDCDHCIL